MVNAGTPYSDGQVWDDQDSNWSVGFGDGTDGAFSESSGTTNLTQGTLYQYTSFLLDTSATISASTTSTKPVIIYVQGNAVINGTISLTGKGNAGGVGYDTTTSHSWGTPGLAGAAGGTGGIKGMAWMNYAYNQKGFIMNGTGGGSGTSAGGNTAGGGGGASSDNDGSVGGADGGPADDGTGGVGGAAGCSLIIIVSGTLTFGASSSIDVSGADGTAGTGNQAGGAGGGGAGDIIIIHRGSKTDNGVSTDVTGGSGGAAAGGGGAGGAGAAGNERILDWNEVMF